MGEQDITNLSLDTLLENIELRKEDFRYGGCLITSKISLDRDVRRKLFRVPIRLNASLIILCSKGSISLTSNQTHYTLREHAMFLNRPTAVIQGEADEDAEYEQEFTIDLSTLKPTVAFPHLPENTHTIDEVGEIKIDQVVIGSCTNGRMDDLRVAASILKGHRVAKGLRVIVIPATQQIYLDAMEEGLLKTFIEAGAVVSTPTCGPCLGGYMGILAAGERCISTTNRNFVGRMGHVDSEVYLASPAVAAASAVAFWELCR